MKKLIALVLALVCVLALAGCGKNDTSKIRITNTNEKLICENTISPNEKFVEQEEDKVFYTIKIYQNSNDIKVVLSSNSAFAEDMSYEIECNNEITEDDIKIEWQTIMGDTYFTEENQIAVAVITLSSNGEVISQRKVNFISKAIDIIVDTINNN